MAAISAPNALTPPSSSHGDQGSWNNGMSGAHENVPSLNPKSLQNDQSNYIRQPLSSQTNGTSLTHKPSRTEMTRRTNPDTSHPSKTQGVESAHLAPARVNALGRKDSSVSAASESDSLIDLYGNRSASRSHVSSFDYGERTTGVNGDGYIEFEDDERSRWIHRDKLALIESQELQQAREGRSNSRLHHKRERDRSKERNKEKEEKKQHVEVVSQEATGKEEPTMSFDLRLPEEAAEDPYEEHRTGNRQPTQKASYSRIPLSTSSPIPVPQYHVERRAPLQRNGSGAWNSDEEIPATTKIRGRSQSVGSQVLLDDADSSPTHTAQPSASTPSGSNKTSPSKAKTPSKATPTSGGRKASNPANRNTSATRKTSTTTRAAQNRENPSPRPGTRSGDFSPRAPEGDPPWLDSMYKPDPRLPPDQQLLPTVARRLQQEQWEREGKFGNTYDKEFQPLNVREQEEPTIKTQTVDAPKPSEADAEWPLRSPKTPTTAADDSQNGGYKTVPDVSSPQASPLTPTKAAKPEPVRVQEPPEETKGCKCCIVM